MYNLDSFFELINSKKLSKLHIQQHSETARRDPEAARKPQLVRGVLCSPAKGVEQRSEERRSQAHVVKTSRVV